MVVLQKTALYLGASDTMRDQVVTALETAGYQTVYTHQACSRFDLVVDNRSKTAGELRVAFSAVGLQCKQYLLVSSCAVYPATPRLRPWQESDADICVDMHGCLTQAVQVARRTERELRLLAGDRIPFTIMRPALIEGIGMPNPISNWLVDRILHGGMLVLPEGDLPSYRLVQPADLAAAIVVVAGRPEAFAQVLNVTGQGMLSYWGHAAMLRDGLRRELRFAYVPAWRWRAANLSLPLGEVASCSLIEPSKLLHELGWRPSDPVLAVEQLALTSAAEGRQPDLRVIEKERRIASDAAAEQEYTPGIAPYPLPSVPTQQRALRGWPGHPGSLSLERLQQVHNFPDPVVKVRALALGVPEERLLKGEFPQQGARVIGHNALLEVVRSGKSGVTVGSTMLPLSYMPCGEPGCPFCGNGVLGIGCDGYGWGVCTTPPSHLVPVPPALGMAALLADSLGSLLWALSDVLAAGDGPVWIAGRTVEAALAVWLAQDVGRPAVLVDRRAFEHPEFPTHRIDDMLQQLRNGEVTPPTLAVDLTGSCDVSWPLSCALAAGSSLWARSRPPGVSRGIHWHELPAAPSRHYLELAIATLVRWQSFRDLSLRVGPAIPFDLFWDAFLPAPFSQPYLEERP